MTNFKKYFGQLAVILAATSAYPTLSQELDVETAASLQNAAKAALVIEIETPDFAVREQALTTLQGETQKYIRASLFAMNEEEQNETPLKERSE